MYFKTKQLVAMALFGAIIFAAVFILGSAVLSVTGIPATGGIVNMFFAIMLVVLGLRIIDKFGAASIMLAITGALAIPTMTFGAPGVYKIAQLFLIGLIIDIVVAFFKRTQKGYVIGGAIAGSLAAPMIYWFLIILGLPGAEKIKPLSLPLVGIYLLLGLFGALFGNWLYEKKLKDKAFVKQLQN